MNIMILGDLRKNILMKFGLISIYIGISYVSMTVVSLKKLESALNFLHLKHEILHSVNLKGLRVIYWVRIDDLQVVKYRHELSNNKIIAFIQLNENYIKQYRFKPNTGCKQPVCIYQFQDLSIGQSICQNQEFGIFVRVKCRLLKSQ